MKAILVTFALAVASAAGPAALAQTYPAKPITIVVPFAAGGPTDTLARLLAERMRKTLGQAIIVDNTTGAGGSIATAKVVRAPPDGYMVSIGHWGSHVESEGADCLDPQGRDRQVVSDDQGGRPQGRVITAA